tara:strand:+ start:1093 stop:1455 length:363 start_codon:yes stop_codon:yes gene_type:complete
MHLFGESVPAQTVVGALTMFIGKGFTLGSVVAFDNDAMTGEPLLDDTHSPVVLFTGLAFAQHTHVDGDECTEAISRDSRELTMAPVDFARGITIGTRRGTLVLPVEDMVVNEGALIVGAL